MTERAAQDALPVVLLIDDDLISREVIATVLAMNGYRVHTAGSGEAALALVAGAADSLEPVRPDAVLMDAQMPGISGAELIGKLRGATRAPVYVISGSQPSADIVSAADGFLLKPFNPDEFRNLLGGKKSEPVAAVADRPETVVSAQVLAQFRALMPASAVHQVYEAVVVDLERRIGALANAITAGDAAEVRRLGHAIKGACAMVGAVEAARLGGLLEAAENSGDNQLDDCAILLRDLRAATARLQNMLNVEMPA